MSLVAHLQPPADYIESRGHIFPSAASLEWFIRRNNRELKEAGALQFPLGRTLIDPSAFDRVVLEVGQRRARRTCVRG